MRVHGRAKVSSRNPRAFAICDRCGFLYNHPDLKWQFDFAGASLINKRILVCNQCYDTPQNQLRSIVIPSDPTPIMNARVQDYAAAETNYIVTTEPPQIDPTTGIPIPQYQFIVDQNGNFLTQLPYGEPVGLDQNAIMPLQGTIKYGEEVPFLSIVSDGTTTVNVTCSSPHNLSTNNQIAVEGLTNGLATGFYSVNVTTATAFNYITYNPIPAASLATATTLMKTANIGLPYGYTQIPQVGP